MSICKQIAKRPHLADDLYQEFFLSLLEIKDERLVEAYNGGYLEVLCVGIINNIWGKRDRVKTYVNGRTSPLYETRGVLIINGKESEDSDYDNWGGFILAERLVDETPEYDFKRDIDETILHHIIDKYKESVNQDERFISRVFWYSKFKYKNVGQFAKESGIPRGVCYAAYKRFKQKIKEEICKY